MSGLTKEQILSYKRAPIKPVEAFGGTVYVTTITLKQRELWEQVVGNAATKHKSRATYLSYVICDENGNKLFTTEDIERLQSMEYSEDVDKVFLEATTLNRTTVEDLAAATKNS